LSEEGKPLLGTVTPVHNPLSEILCTWKFSSAEGWHHNFPACLSPYAHRLGWQEDCGMTCCWIQVCLFHLNFMENAEGRSKSSARSLKPWWLPALVS
jgi:hypothetical protein